MVVGADDAAVLTALQEADCAGLDCPFGWPEPFVEMLLAHRDGRLRSPDGISGLAWRRTLSRRATDLACEQVTGVRPLSVSADRIAAVAMRGAGILGALAAKRRPVDRAGGDTVVECYPAAALRAWGCRTSRTSAPAVRQVWTVSSTGSWPLSPAWTWAATRRRSGRPTTRSTRWSAPSLRGRLRSGP